MAFASVVRITSARWLRFCFWCAIAHALAKRTPRRSEPRFRLWNSCHAGVSTRRRRAGRATGCGLSASRQVTKRFHEIFGRRDSIETGFSLWTRARLSSGLHRKAGLLLSDLPAAAARILAQIGVDGWAPPSLRSPEEAEALGENAAVYLKAATRLEPPRGRAALSAVTA